MSEIKERAVNEFEIKEMKYKDIIDVQMCNHRNLPENYILKYYLYHLTMCPGYNFVCSWTDKNSITQALHNTEKKDFSIYCNELTQPISENTYLAGYVLGKIEDVEENGKHSIIGHVASICVDEPFRRKGIAEKLMAKLLEKFRSKFDEIGFSQNYLKIFLKVRVSNKVAINFYEKLGFVKIEIKNDYYSDLEDAWTMMCKLNK